MKITSLLTQHFHWEASPSQQLFFQSFEQFFNAKEKDKCLILKGYAGTGKTTCLNAIVKSLPTLGYQSVLLAPTGRASKVMSLYTGKKAFTIHKRIYRKKSTDLSDNSFVLAPNLATKTIFMVDEASMITDDHSEFRASSLLEDLVQYVYNQKDCYLMLIGDSAQLPPVGIEFSYALDLKYLQSKFTFTLFHTELEEVIRQAAHSGILYNATQIRKQIVQNTSVYPKFYLKNFKDIYKMTGAKLVEGLEYAYHKFGIENSIVICRSNKSANLYNQQIRARILYREEELTGGDYIMVVKNNYFWLAQEEGFIANGAIAEVERVLRIEEKFGLKFADVRIRFIDDENSSSVDCKVLMDTILIESPNMPYSAMNAFYEELKEYFSHLPSIKEQKEALKGDPYYNAIQIKFAYAITCHKAQGGQWNAVFVDQGYLTDELLNVSFLRWMYTAATRASEELFLVNFSSKFFENADVLEEW